MDAIDQKIIAALQADGRLTNQELSERVGLSPSLTGWMRRRCLSTQLAVPLKKTMTQWKNLKNRCSGPTSAMVTPSDLRMAMDLGTNSPSTTCRKVNEA